MYNEANKKRYIVEKESTTVLPKGYLQKCFENFSEFEDKYKKDLCNFTSYEILDSYKSLNTHSIERLANIHSTLTHYTYWSMTQGVVVDNQNHYEEIERNELLQCINTILLQKRIVTRETLLNWMQQLPNPGEAFIIGATFEGICGLHSSELWSLKTSDFDGNKVKLCTGREIEISNELLHYAKLAGEETQYYSTGERVYTFQPSDLIIKNFPNSSEDCSSYQKGRRIYSKIIRVFSYLGVENWMTQKGLIDSGKIHMIKERSHELGISTYDYIFGEHIKEVEDRFNSSMTQKNLFYEKYKEHF